MAVTGRAQYVGITDDEAVEAFLALSRYEGIIPAVESSHALAYALKVARENAEAGVPQDKQPVILVNLSGRGDKDVDQIRERLGGSFSEDGAVKRAAELISG